MVTVRFGVWSGVAATSCATGCGACGAGVCVDGRVFRGDEVKKDRDQRRFVAKNE
jgi:hypothetical protein